MIPLQPFGQTGHQSTRIIFGAAAFWKATPGGRGPDAGAAAGARHQPHRRRRQLRRRRAPRRPLDGAAPRPLLPRHQDRRAHLRGRARPDTPLARTPARRLGGPAAAAQPRRPEAEWETAMGPGGALEAAIEARDQGLVRFIGVTGHGVIVAEMHRRSLERFPFDSVLLPLQLHDDAEPGLRRATSRRCSRSASERDVAVQTIKGITLGPWGEKETRTSDLVRGADRAGRHRPRGAAGCSATTACSSTARRISACSRRSWTPPSDTRLRRPTPRWKRWYRARR